MAMIRVDEGYEKMAYAIIQQAVEDVQELTKKKIIVNGKCIDVWPQRKNNVAMKFLGFYNKKHAVIELIHWFNEGTFEEFLAFVGSEIDSLAVRRQLGLVSEG